MTEADYADARVQRMRKGWDVVGTPEWRENACWKLQLTSQLNMVIESARAYRKHGTLWTHGGLGDQPLWWWRQVRTALAYIDPLETALMSRKDGAYEARLGAMKSEIKKDLAREVFKARRTQGRKVS